MARRLMGCTSADMAVTDTGAPAPGAGPYDVWSARTGGTQLTDLTDLDGAAVTQVTFMPDGYLRYYTAADDVLPVHWVDTGQDERIAVRPVDLTGPAGPPPEIAAGTVTVTDLPTGEPATAELTLTETDPGSYDLDAAFGIPAGGQGATGPANSLSIGTVITVPVGGSATATISGTPPSQTLDLGIPTGATGSPGADGAAIGGLLTTKGDLAGRSSSAAVRVPVGSNGQALVADSNAAEGVVWSTVLPRRADAAAGRFIIPGDTFGTIANPTVSRYIASPVWMGAPQMVDALTVEVSANSNGAGVDRSVTLGILALGASGWSLITGASVALTVPGATTGVLTAVLSSPVRVGPGIVAPTILCATTQSGVTYRAVASNWLVAQLTTRASFDAATARAAGMSSSSGNPWSAVPLIESNANGVPAVGMRISA